VPSAVHEIITHANFGEDRLRGFGVASGRILAFFIALLRRNYNTLALLCECVISIKKPQFIYRLVNDGIAHQKQQISGKMGLRSTTSPSVNVLRV